jgi:two-component sensor histidine kinase
MKNLLIRLRSVLAALIILIAAFPFFDFISEKQLAGIIREARTAVLSHTQSVSAHFNSKLKIYDLILQAGGELPSFRGIGNILGSDILRLQETRNLLLFESTGAFADSLKDPAGDRERLLEHSGFSTQLSAGRPFQIGLVEIDRRPHLFLSRRYSGSAERPDRYAVLLLQRLTLLSEHSLFAYPVRLLAIMDETGGAFSLMSDPPTPITEDLLKVHNLLRAGGSYGTRLDGSLVYTGDNLRDFPFSLLAAYDIQGELDKALRFRRGLFFFGYSGVTAALVTAFSLFRLIRADRRNKAELRMRATIIREIHHRIKNNLQTVSSLLNIQGMQVDDPRVHEAFTVAQMRLQVISILHEELYRRESLSEIILHDYIGTLTSTLGELHGLSERKISFRNEVDPSIQLDFKQAQACGLLVHELLTNSLKHAFPDGREGTIVIRGKGEDESLTLSVRDDGIGFRQKGIEKDGLGFSLIESLAKQLHGAFTVDSSKGTRFDIRFPRSLGN